MEVRTMSKKIGFVLLGMVVLLLFAGSVSSLSTDFIWSLQLSDRSSFSDLRWSGEQIFLSGYDQGPEEKRLWILSMDHHANIRKIIFPHLSFQSDSPRIAYKSEDHYLTSRNNTAFFVVKLNADGDILWRNEYDSGIQPRSRGIEIGPEGKIYVTGTDGRSFVTRKINPNGKTRWTQIETSSARYDGARDLDVYDNHVYVTGEYKDDGYRTIKYSLRGKKVWVKNFDGPGNDRAHTLKVSESGSIYVLGKSLGKKPHHPRLLKYNPEGRLLWNQTYLTHTTASQIPLTMDFDSKRNIIFGGKLKYTNNQSFLLSVNPRGEKLWDVQIPPNQISKLKTLYAKNNSLYVAGSRDDQATLVKFDIPESRQYTPPSVTDEIRNLRNRLEKLQKKIEALTKRIRRNLRRHHPK